MDNSENTDAMRSVGRDDKLNANKINLIAGMQLVATVIVCVVMVYFFAQKNPNWQSDPVALTVISTLVIGGVVAQIIIRLLLGGKLSAQKAQMDTVIKNYVAERAAIKTPQKEKISTKKCF